jgi:hypothetical protein
VKGLWAAGRSSSSSPLCSNPSSSSPHSSYARAGTSRPPRRAALALPVRAALLFPFPARPSPSPCAVSRASVAASASHFFFFCARRAQISLPHFPLPLLRALARPHFSQDGAAGF